MAGTQSKTHQIAVLTSGMSRGSNLQAMHAYFQEHNLPVVIAFVVVTRRSAPVIEYCEEHGIPTMFISSLDIPAFELKLSQQLQSEGIELLALAGFLKQLSEAFISKHKIPILNIHPALLPKYGGAGFYGMRVHEAVYEAGEKTSGATVHYLSAEYDSGLIISQEAVDISACLSPQEIALQVLQIEHKIYGPAICKVLNL